MRDKEIKESVSKVRTEREREREKDLVSAREGNGDENGVILCDKNFQGFYFWALFTFFCFSILSCYCILTLSLQTRFLWNGVIILPSFWSFLVTISFPFFEFLENLIGTERFFLEPNLHPTYLKLSYIVFHQHWSDQDSILIKFLEFQISMRDQRLFEVFWIFRQTKLDRKTHAWE